MGMPKRSHSGSSRSPLPFRFGRQPKVESSSTSPFTVMPEELKRSRFSLGRFLRGAFSTLFLLALALALLALVAAFAYQLIYNPQALSELSYSFISRVQGFVSGLTAAP